MTWVFQDGMEISRRWKRRASNQHLQGHEIAVEALWSELHVGEIVQAEMWEIDQKTLKIFDFNFKEESD